jgi:D-apionolactonase
MFTKSILYHGKPDLPADVLELRAGPLTAIYDSGDLRYIRYRDNEIVRRLYAAVRDQNWGTVPAKLQDVQIEQEDDSFRITYTAQHIDATLGIDFEWRATIEGKSDGTIRFEMDGHANSQFKRNRIGFCVLHPMDLAGQAVTIWHDDGSQESGTFPEFIAPHQPFFNIRAIQHDVGDARASITFEGEVFEMEDQRNWTDASYKTYCTPLSHPFPVTVEVGENVHQAVTVQVVGARKGEVPTERPLTVDANADDSVSIPQIGFGIASHSHTLTDTEKERLCRLAPSHLRVDLRMNTSGGARLQDATDQAHALNTTLLVAVHLTDDANMELDALVKHLTDIDPPLDAFLIFHQGEKSTNSKWVALAQEKLERFGVPIGTGTDAFFTELNRGRPAEDARDFVTFSTNPQVHAFEIVDLVETLAAHTPLIDTARIFSHDKPVTVSPVTLKMRFNPNATGPEPAPPPGELPSQVDVRQMSLFGAGWTLGSLKYLAAQNVERITYYETTGWRGVMETEHAGAVDPDLFPSQPGMIYPMYFIFADVADFAGGELVKVKTSDPLSVEGILLRDGNRQRLLLANLRPTVQSVHLKLPPGKYHMRQLDETNVENVMHNPNAYLDVDPTLIDEDTPLSLLPFAITRIDIT